MKAAVTLSQRLGPGFNDALAYLVMREMGAEEIFSFDRDFDEIPRGYQENPVTYNCVGVDLVFLFQCLLYAAELFEGVLQVLYDLCG
ncbi:PIN domain-containing protein [Candidatus Bathyarchaeota archaeon]|nr:PIN domain-containing protein [Candidatus Bathyarchaeota archaeon]